jgi:Fur family zinc uptake transcriptional regulator
MKKAGLDQKKFLKAAELLSKEKGHRWTEMREAVFACILNQDKPVTAYQLIDQLSKAQNKDIKPASVYRSLDALCALGMVVKIESLNAFMACVHPEHHHEHVFLVCRTCGSADELADHAVSKKLNADASHQGFKIERQVLELQGACRDCQT